MILFVGILLWLGFGLASWCAYQGAHKNACYGWLPPEIVTPLAMILFGPLGLLVVGLVYDLEYWSFFPITKEGRWELWKSRGYGDSPADRKEFEGYK